MSVSPEPDRLFPSVMSPRSPAATRISARTRPPRLVLLFAVLTALGVAAAAAVILTVVREADVAQAHAHAIERARFAARAVLSPELGASDLTTHSPRRTRQLDSLFRDRVLLEGFRAATLYGSAGRPIYSTAGDPASGGSTAVHVRDALSGATVSEIATARDGVRVLRVYLPIGVSRTGGVGVIQLDQEYGSVVAAATRSSWLIAGVLEGLLALLFLAFVPLLARASARIRSHVADLEHAARHDELTGLPNRHGFRHVAGAALVRGEPAAILLVDLDGFAEINRSLGPATGDLLLIHAGERLARELASDTTFVARLGEDEFGVLLEGADHAEVERVADQIRMRFAQPFVLDGIRVAVSVDIGAGLYPEHGSDLDGVLACASAALSMSKAEERSGVQVYRHALGASDRSRVELAAELRDAVAGNQLLVYYQPQADLLTQQIRGVEALVRWEHPRRGLLAADEFISHVDRSGVGQELRRFVVATAAHQWHEWRLRGLDLEVAINLSAVDLLDPSLPAELEEVIMAYGIPPWNLVLEVTERTLVGDVRRASAVAEHLDRIGVRLSIDDFGTGYSSLASLRRFPIQQVKLDRSLLADVPGDAGAEAVVGGSVEIAHGLGALIVAEGIETRDQWRFAYTVGCDIAQGFLIGRPAPPEELLDLLETPRLVPLSAA